ncbi:MAG: YraN family protein [Chloroflexota bacterium]
MSVTRQHLGRLGEAAATRYLERAGWQIVDRNYRCPLGEIDIVGRDGDALVFVEVRTRSNSRFGAPEESVTPAKARRMAQCALAYLEAHPAHDGDWRVDFVAVLIERGRVVRLEHYKHALQ